MRDLDVVVVYASPDQQISCSCTLAPHSNVAMAIRRSGILDRCDNLQLESMVVGIYGRRVGLDASLQHGDRIEIYRPLQVDPMTARRLRVKKKRP